jgi:DNA-directed RNA polymerase subunit K/omega
MFPSGSYNLILIISKRALSSVSVTFKIKNFQNMSFENKHNSVDIALDDVNELFFETARLSKVVYFHKK